MLPVCMHVWARHLWKSMNFQDMYCFIRQEKKSCTVPMATILLHRNDSSTVSQLIAELPDTQTCITEIIPKEKSYFKAEEWRAELDQMRSSGRFLALQFDTAAAWEMGSKFKLQQYLRPGNKTGFCDTITPSEWHQQHVHVCECLDSFISYPGCYCSVCTLNASLSPCWMSKPVCYKAIRYLSDRAQPGCKAKFVTA